MIDKCWAVIVIESLPFDELCRAKVQVSAVTSASIWQGRVSRMVSGEEV